METLDAQEITSPLQPPAYTVDSLIERMGVKANIALWNNIDTIIRVQGTVGKVKPYANASYFDLRGGENKLTVKCEVALSPKEGDYVIVEGTPSFRPSKFNIGLEIIVTGTPVSQLDIKDAELAVALPNIEKPRYLRLYDYLRDHSIEYLHLLGTETAIRDVVSHIDTKVAKNITSQTMRVSDKEDISNKIGNIPNSTKAIAIVRGGDDATLEIWNDREVIEELISLGIPFYLALGHTHGMTLAARYADETFHTPSAFGSTITSITRQIEQEHDIKQRGDTFIKKEKMFTEREKSFLQQEKAFMDQAKQFEENKKILLSHEKVLKEKEALLTKNITDQKNTFQQQLNDKDKAMEQSLLDIKTHVNNKLLPYKIVIGVLTVMIILVVLLVF